MNNLNTENKIVLNKKDKAKFIVFEGIDGSGQTTQAKLLSDFLKKKGYKVLLTKEPTDISEAGKLIKKILFKKKKISPGKLQELFAKDRKIHLKKVIIPALSKGKIVISDRYFFSSFAYGKSDGLSIKKLYKMNKGFIFPDITFFLKVSPETSIRRIEKRNKPKSIFEKKEKLNNVLREYLTILKKFKNIKIIDGEKSKEKVFSDIKREVLKII